MLNLDTPVELTKEQKDIIKSFGILSVDDWKKNEILNQGYSYGHFHTTN